MKPLGIIFIVIGILCAVGGFSNSKESRMEEIYSESADDLGKIRNASEALDNLAIASGVTLPRDLTRQTYRQLSDSSSKYEAYREERVSKMRWFFIAAVGFGVLGLILAASAQQKKA